MDFITAIVQAIAKRIAYELLSNDYDRMQKARDNYEQHVTALTPDEKKLFDDYLCNWILTGLLEP